MENEIKADAMERAGELSGSQAMMSCTCGLPRAAGVMHRSSGPCYSISKPDLSGLTDADMLDWLERMGNDPEGLLLHDGGDFMGRRGLGLRRIGRSLRQAIMQAYSPAGDQDQP